MKLFARGFSHLPPLPKTKTRRILAAGVVSLAAFCTLHAGGAPPQPCDSAMLRAAQRMDEAVRTVARHRDSTGGILDVSLDPNRTGLIGPEDGELTTSVGHLEAKRTTANPDMAALIVHLLCRAGAKAGDTIAVGSSGSFPALLVAT
ncbi:MAG: poly-gamma-glutamate system protein, partial [Acidobacteria bacterium]|nr:poly-gamma-glutamate system protein [Acidobacteriota bacterium]